MALLLRVVTRFCGLATRRVPFAGTWARRTMLLVATGFCAVKRLVFGLGEEPVIQLSLGERMGKRKASIGKSFL